MEGARKKELRQGYRQRETTGGVYLIRNTTNNKVLVESAQDLQGALHRFAFGKQTGSCLHLKLQKDWTEQGAGVFDLEVLEEYKKGDTQTQEEFQNDIKLLLELWRDRYVKEDTY